MEIVNNPTCGYAPEANDEAVSFLDYLWKHGYVVFGLGGSDSHNLESERYEGATEPSIPGGAEGYGRYFNSLCWCAGSDYEVIARDEIAVIVNADNPLNDITMDQLEAIYTGKTTEWKAIYR